MWTLPPGNFEHIESTNTEKASSKHTEEKIGTNHKSYGLGNNQTHARNGNTEEANPEVHPLASYGPIAQ
jgi:hypothetical protein